MDEEKRDRNIGGRVSQRVEAMLKEMARDDSRSVSDFLNLLIQREYETRKHAQQAK
jgi:hypothetical protein